MKRNPNALCCPQCGCAKFIEFVEARTMAYAQFLNRDDYPVVGKPFDRDTDDIWFECSECAWYLDLELLVDPAA